MCFFLSDTTGKTSYKILFMFLCCNTDITIYCNANTTITITFYIPGKKYWYNYIFQILDQNTIMYNSKLGTIMYTTVQLKSWYNYMLIILSCFSCLPRFKCAAHFKYDSCTFFRLVVPGVLARVILP